MEKPTHCLCPGEPEAWEGPSPERQSCRTRGMEGATQPTGEALGLSESCRVSVGGGTQVSTHISSLPVSLDRYT